MTDKENTVVPLFKGMVVTEGGVVNEAPIESLVEFLTEMKESAEKGVLRAGIFIGIDSDSKLYQWVRGEALDNAFTLYTSLDFVKDEFKENIIWPLMGKDIMYYEDDE